MTNHIDTLPTTGVVHLTLTGLHAGTYFCGRYGTTLGELTVGERRPQDSGVHYAYASDRVLAGRGVMPVCPDCRAAGAAEGLLPRLAAPKVCATSTVLPVVHVLTPDDQALLDLFSPEDHPGDEDDDCFRYDGMTCECGSRLSPYAGPDATLLLCCRSCGYDTAL